MGIFQVKWHLNSQPLDKWTTLDHLNEYFSEDLHWLDDFFLQYFLLFFTYLPLVVVGNQTEKRAPSPQSLRNFKGLVVFWPKNNHWKIIYCRMLKQTIWLQLTLNFPMDLELQGFELGTFRFQSQRSTT